MSMVKHLSQTTNTSINMSKFNLETILVCVIQSSVNSQFTQTSLFNIIYASAAILRGNDIAKCILYQEANVKVWRLMLDLFLLSEELLWMRN